MTLRSLKNSNKLILVFFGLGFLGACAGKDEPADFDCSTSDLDITSPVILQPTNCSGNGSITVLGIGGKEPYKYALNAGVFGNVDEFNNLAAGDYTVRVKDKHGCEAFVEVSLQLPGADPLTADAMITADTECFTNNGIIEVVASGGQEPYQYKLGNGAFGNDPTFPDLAPGNYSVSAKDALDCVFVKSITVTKGDSGTSLENDILPIIEINCAVDNCHNGSEQPNFTNPQNVRTHAAKIKQLTQSGEMPRDGTLSAQDKALIACWVDEGSKDN